MAVVISIMMLALVWSAHADEKPASITASDGRSSKDAQVDAPLPPRPKDAFQWVNDLNSKIPHFWKVRGGIKLVIVGDSRGDCGVDPRAFYAGADPNVPCAFNFAVGATGFYVEEIVLTEYAVHAPKLEWVVFQISPRLFNQYYHDSGIDSLLASGGLKFDRAHQDQIWAKLPPESWGPQSPSETLRNWGWHSDVTESVAGTSPETLVNAAKRGRYELAADRWERFERLLDLFAKRNVKVLGYISPLPQLLAETTCADKDGTPHATYWALVQSLTELRLKHPNFFFLDVHRGGQHDFPPEEYSTWDHLNAKGSRRLMPSLEALRKAVDAQPKLDVTPPAVFSVTAVGDPDRVTVYFTKPIGKAEAEDAANYEIAGSDTRANIGLPLFARTDVTVQRASLADDLRTVTLRTSPLRENARYLLTVKKVKDRADNAVAGAAAPFTFVEAFQPRATSPSNYVWGKLAVGATPYVDAPSALTAVPARYAGLDVLRTAQADKAATGDTFLSFEVNYPVRVYVAHDEAVQIKPAWLEPFIYTWDILTVGKDKFRIAWKDFPAGKVTLGGNAGPTGHGSTAAPLSMYFALVEPMGSVIATRNPGVAVRPVPPEAPRSAP